MAEDYTPTTAQVRQLYANSMDPAGFNRWLAEVRREAAEKALRDAADDPVAEEFLRALPPAEYGEHAVETSAEWLRRRAAHIARGEGS